MKELKLYDIITVKNKNEKLFFGKVIKITNKEINLLISNSEIRILELKNIKIVSMQKFETYKKFIINYKEMKNELNTNKNN